MASQTVQTICFECHSRCGVLLDVAEGSVTAIRGDSSHPHSHGYLCPKGKACMEIMYHPERITAPLVRVGGKDSDRFEETSWDTALGIIAEHLLAARERTGPESVVFGTGTTRGTAPYLNRFLSLFGSPNLMAPANMSGGPLAIGSVVTCGFGLANPDYAGSTCILLWAHNPEASFPGLYMHDLNSGLKQGSKLIVVDPRRTRLAGRADHWLRIRPGTDTALVLCFINLIIQKGLYDAEFVEKWCSGFEKLARHVSPFTVEKTAAITWIPAQQIEAAAETFARNRPASIGAGMAGVCQHNDAFDLCRGLTILSAITGNLAVPGGNLHCNAPTSKRSCYGPDYNTFLNLPQEQALKKLGIDQFPIMQFVPIPSPPQPVWRAIEEKTPYPVSVIGLFANNSVCAYPNSRRVREALRSLDFLFSVDYFHTPTTVLSDVILPPAHWTERDDVEDLMMKNHVMAQVKAVEPRGDCRDEKQILIDLAVKTGLDGYWKSVEEMLDYRLEYVGMSWREFKEKGRHFNPFQHRQDELKGRFRTASGKVELCSDILESIGIQPMPEYREPAESPVSRPDLVTEFPLVLTTGGRLLHYYHSSHRNIPSLRKRGSDPELLIHPGTAAQLAIEEGEWVNLVSPRGAVEIRVRFDDDTHPQVVHAPHGFWYGEEDGWRRLNINMITDDENMCPVTASVPIKSMLCRVEQRRPFTRPRGEHP